MTKQASVVHGKAIVDPGTIQGPSRGIRATPGLSVSDQCHQLGLQVGDTIEGRSEFHAGYWTEARLTLLWLGNQAACFRVSERNVIEQAWSEPHENCAWKLDVREWRKVTQ